MSECVKCGKEFGGPGRYCSDCSGLGWDGWLKLAVLGAIAWGLLSEFIRSAMSSIHQFFAWLLRQIVILGMEGALLGCLCVVAWCVVVFVRVRRGRTTGKSQLYHAIGTAAFSVVAPGAFFMWGRSLGVESIRLMGPVPIGHALLAGATAALLLSLISLGFAVYRVRVDARTE